jgi:hypothetical protein
VMHGRTAIHHEGELDDDARGCEKHRRPRMNLPERQRSFRRACESKSTLGHCDIVPACCAGFIKTSITMKTPQSKPLSLF